MNSSLVSCEIIENSALSKAGIEPPESNDETVHPVPLIVNLVEEQVKSIDGDESVVVTNNPKSSKSAALLLTPRRRSVRLTARLQNKSQNMESVSVSLKGMYNC